MTHNILDLLPRLPAVTYTIKISQRHDGSTNTTRQYGQRSYGGESASQWGSYYD